MNLLSHSTQILKVEMIAFHLRSQISDHTHIRNVQLLFDEVEAHENLV